MDNMEPKMAIFRFYAELNDFLHEDRRKRELEYNFSGNPSVKDAIEAIGIPHTEVDLILVNTQSKNFDYHIKNGDRISVYPVFESMDVSSVTQEREKPLRNLRFIADVNLGQLAKYMRMFGFDTLYENSYQDKDIINMANTENRVILTKDKGILKNGIVTRGYYVRNSRAKKQIEEVIRRFDLFLSINPFARCMRCNGLIKKVPKETIMDKLQPKTKLYYNDFYQCTSCGQIYWLGSHYEKMKKFMDFFMAQQP